MENLYCVEESVSLIFLHYNNLYISYIKYDDYTSKACLRLIDQIPSVNSIHEDM